MYNEHVYMTMCVRARSVHISILYTERGKLAYKSKLADIYNEKIEREKRARTIQMNLWCGVRCYV